MNRRLTVLSKGGHPLLYLPILRQSATRAMSLYPAQRKAARAARALLRCLCGCGLGRFLPGTTVTIDPDAPLTGFIESLDGGRRLPDFAVLAGNPHTPGRRFIFMVFGSNHEPVAVVKVGMGQQATHLIRQELSTLESAPSTALGIPHVRATLSDDTIDALAMDYLEGTSPEPVPTNQMSVLLSSWIDVERKVSVEAVPCWQRLAKSCSNSSLFQTLRQKLEAERFHPVLYHGDFTPWNIKVTPGRGEWKVLDWERGEPTGLPCWDWFHYRIQVGILVTRLPATALVSHIDQWIKDDDLLHYAKRAGVGGILHELLLTYLLYTLEITCPSEGLPVTRDLLNLIETKWNRA